MGTTNRLRLSLSGYGSYNKTDILFDPNATNAYDWNDDAFKLPGTNPNYPNLATVTSDGLSMSINSFPPDYQNFNIPVRVFWSGSPSVTDFNLALTVDELPAAMSSVCIEDLATGNSTDLAEGATYNFFMSYSGAPSRFILHGLASECITATGDNFNSKNENIKIFGDIDGIAIVFNLKESSNAIIELYNILGQQIVSRTTVIQKGKVLLEKAQLSPGTFFVRVTTAENTIIEKIALGF